MLSQSTATVATVCGHNPERCPLHAPDSATVQLFGLAPESVVDGPGLRFAVFVQGCPHHCPACHNSASHDPAGGYTASVDAIIRQIEENPLLSGVTLSGGEPFAQPRPLILLAERVKARGLNVLTYSGYTLDALREFGATQSDVAALLALTDFLIDGPYIAAERDLTLAFRGSANQCVWQQIDGVFVPTDF